MEFGNSSPTGAGSPSLRKFPSKRALIIIAVAAVFAVGVFLSYGFASFAGTPTTSTATTGTASTSSSGSASGSPHHCPRMKGLTGTSCSPTTG
ncbi:MAG TPA: hypothetical protein VFF30_12300 [Nitrososphaerales archaeon]|nr:hypothetical protein [Nitrososphaerales archaeon]